MTFFKRALFWILFVPSLIVIFFAELITYMCYLALEGMHRFEGWALDYKRNYKYAGDGIWLGKNDDDTP